MKRSVLLTGALLMLTTAAFAAPPKEKGKKPATPTKIKCAVMTQDTVDVKKATEAKMFADYKGNRYFFCCAGCPEAFKKDPAKYAKNAHIPTPKAEKGKKS